jgi:RNA polymerase sigma factor (sigma-70 family)
VQALPQPESISSADRALVALLDGDERGLIWLRERIEQRAARRFSPWAWEHIAEDFSADLRFALVTAWRRPGFSAADASAYVDVSIANLCRRYYRVVARLRAQRELDGDALELAAVRSSALERVGAALELHAVFAELEPECRRRLVDKYVHGQSMQEMAEREGIAEPTMRSRLHACRAAFRRIHARLQHSAPSQLLSDGGMHDE